VDSVNLVGKYSSLALDNDDKPRISYYDETNRDLRYAFLNGSSWQVETVDSVNLVGKYSSLALDSDDKPRISYYDATNRDLKYASFDGSSWQVETVEGTNSVGEYSFLVLDGSGDPRISYYDATNADLKYAFVVPTTTTTTAIGSSTTTSSTTTTVPSICILEELYGGRSEEVALLRTLRDSFLVTTPEGREMVRLYYRVSPYIADHVREKSGFAFEIKDSISALLIQLKEGLK
jgi:hypothetical protein